MSFFENLKSEFADSSVTDLLFQRPGTDGRIIPKKPILSSQYSIYIRIDSEKFSDVLQITSYNVTKNINEKKKFRPYGFKQNIDLITHEGYDIRIDGDRTDENLSILINLYDIYSGTLPYSNGPVITPVIDIIEIVNHGVDIKGEPDKIEITEYKNCTISSYSYDVNGDNSVSTYSLSLFCPYKEVYFQVRSAGVESGRLSKTVSNIINSILDSSDTFK
jgi:hypothetical protein